MTDEAGHYKHLGRSSPRMTSSTTAKGEYVRGDVHTNTLEGYFSIFKRGMKGVYQHCGKQHLHRYVAEFEFRYNNRVANGPDDSTRSEIALRGVRRQTIDDRVVRARLMNATAPLDLLGSGIFTVPQAAELVQASPAVVRLWVTGRKGRQAPVIDNELGIVDGKVVVSFTNLMELRFIAKFHNAGVRLNEIRKIMDEAKQLLEHPHPTATRLVFRTDGKKIMAEIGRRHGIDFLYDLRSRNYEMPTIVMPSLKDDVIFDKNDDIVAWYPRKRR